MSSRMGLVEKFLFYPYKEYQAKMLVTIEAAAISFSQATQEQYYNELPAFGEIEPKP